MTRAMRLALAFVAAATFAACGSPSREPLPITPPAEVANAPVARIPVPPATAPAAEPGASAQSSASPANSKLDPATFPAGAIYVCASGPATQVTLTAIAFDPKVGSLCRRHPEMGPCQYERSICRKSGGKVYAADGTEITMATEAEYDRKVMRVRFQAK
ncbi:MAG: hypothetical protein DYH14_10320 [Betaproteobacteria bacterium PRO3]|nr:hypothetical protein [Betaproteobacteria bacterium PRO3]